MRRFEHRVALPVDQLLLVLGKATPEQEHQAVVPLGQPLDHAVREPFPASPLVRSGLFSADREGRVQEQDTLVGPWAQITRCRDGMPQIAPGSP